MPSHKCLNFLKQGSDPEFDSAMKKIDVMYETIFNDQQLSNIIETLNVRNNSITKPVEQMYNHIFERQDKPHVSKIDSSREETHFYGRNQFIAGEPIYQNTNVFDQRNQNPYQNMHIRAPKSGGYFENWKGLNGKV